MDADQGQSGTGSTEVCRKYRNTGRCRYRNNCKYEHSDGPEIEVPDRPIKARGVCFNFRDGKDCKFAEKCRFFHGSEQDAASEAVVREQKRIENKANGIQPTDGKKRRRGRGKAATGDAKDTDGAPRERTSGAAKKKRPKKKKAAQVEQKNDAGVAYCRNFQKGKCRFEDKCKWAHEMAPVQPQSNDTKDDGGEKKARKRRPRKTGVCYSFRDGGSCQYEESCRFKHGDEDTRDLIAVRRANNKNAGPCYKFIDGDCKWAENCRFSHEAPDDRDHSQATA